MGNDLINQQFLANNEEIKQKRERGEKLSGKNIFLLTMQGLMALFYLAFTLIMLKFLFDMFL